MMTIIDNSLTSLEVISYTKFGFSLNTVSMRSQSSDSSARGRGPKNNRHYKIFFHTLRAITHFNQSSPNSQILHSVALKTDRSEEHTSDLQSHSEIS